jgi:hypothetical protein
MALQGTSMATPVTAGTAALVREYFARGLYPSGVANASAALAASGPLVKAVLVNSGVSLTGGVLVNGGALIGRERERVVLCLTPRVVAVLTPVAGRPELQGFGRVQLDTTLPLGGSPSTRMFVVNNDRRTWRDD